MRVKIDKSGNGAAAQIPSSVMPSPGLRAGQIVEITEQGGRIIIQPIVVPPYNLDRMVDAMDPDTFPEYADFDPAQGGEVW